MSKSLKIEMHHRELLYYYNRALKVVNNRNAREIENTLVYLLRHFTAGWGVYLKLHDYCYRRKYA